MKRIIILTVFILIFLTSCELMAVFNNPDPFYFEAEDDNVKIYIIKENNPNPIYLSYKVNNGEWKDYTFNGNTGEIITLNSKDRLYMKASFVQSSFSSTFARYNRFVIENGRAGAYGNIMYLLDPTGKQLEAPFRCFCSLFDSCTNLTHAPNLPATTLNNSCYNYMFHGCTNLKQAPYLPAKELNDACYYCMFLDSGVTQVICNATSWNETNTSTYHWLVGVPANGTIYLTETIEEKYGSDFIPEGWTVVRASTTEKLESLLTELLK